MDRRGVRCIAVAPLFLICGCLAIGQSPATDYTPTGIAQSVTLKDSSVHYNPDVLKAGAPRSQIHDAFGEPNATRTTDNGQIEDVYAFNPDGTKFVNPTVRPRNIAMAFFSAGASVAVRRARLAVTEHKLTLYHVLYASDGTVQSVRQENLEDQASAPPSQ